MRLGKTLVSSAKMVEMTEKTARDYRDDERLPSARKKQRDYRTRVDPFAEIWAAVQGRLEQEPRLKAKTLFGWIQDQYPGRFPDSTRRTFERRVAGWRSLHGPSKPVSVSLCFSESFEALSGGIQKAFAEFGGVPNQHRSDSLSAAVINHSSQKSFTDRYSALMDHYGCKGQPDDGSFATSPDRSQSTVRTGRMSRR